MALAETVIRKINKLGVLPKAIKFLPKLSLLLAVFSVLWLVTLPQDGNFRNVYISENALMPAQATSYFRESEWNIVRGYREEIGKLEVEPIDIRNKVIESWLQDFGLQVSYHNNGFSNDTLYAIMHAPRGENTEAMALVVPWVNSDGEFNEGAMSLAVALARYFTKMSIWSKNIIFVFPENSHRSLRSWVEAYHTSLDETAGSIEAAIVIEYGKNGDFFEYYDMFYEGLNGQLPNLDLLNTANLVSHHEQIPVAMQGISDRVIDYTTRLKTLFKGILKLAVSGLTNEIHGCEAFSGWQIQAFTIKARGTQGRDVTQFGRVIDSTFRSVNNLLEKFHQSFFFYLMLSPRNFVSIGTYLPSAILLAVSYASSALSTIIVSGLDFKYGIFIILVITFVELGCVVLSVVPVNQMVLVGLGVLSIVPKRRIFAAQVAYPLISISLFAIALLITALLIVHFALAFVIGILALPLTFVPQLMKKNSPLTPCWDIRNCLIICVLHGTRCNVGHGLLLF
ncbi:Subunit of the GPI (Glycosylphosphatidylinositol):protein transamidase complex, putative [Candida maltosa Xu316]|uniref:Subunit of the GPI (Glycosylphosphatidylinositol):protein transamidase complex, putative n=1 Tax=Candida maltosa (strain Xu316) TaxID=1245528 RepID=M3IMV9_CANMX|nr:Subunit of the GPI (Glycosylphosphatidylinositol):protein transamidase complex, putative [Candida maltosa Xu316]